MRALVSLLTGLMVARGLAPSGYGDLTYLLASFVAIRALLDLGSSNAFFTFLSRKPRGRRFYLMYFGWLLLQLVVCVALVVAILPQGMLERIWLGHSRGMVLLALLASFMQQQVWSTISQLGESSRQTIRVQALGVGVALAHLAVVATLTAMGLLSVPTVLAAIIAEHLLAMAVAVGLLRRRASWVVAQDQPSVAEILGDYRRFCQPLIVLAITAFFYDFADKWLLQKFGGSGQQGFYQISAQLAAVSLLATTSILNIFWKEIAEASARRDTARLALMYNRVNRGLLMLGAVVSCFLIPWAEQIVTLLLGEAYSASWVVLALMLFYPIHQSMGQVNAAMFMACERTKSYTIIALVSQLVSLPVSIFLLAPTSGYVISGLSLGATGLALKMVVMNFLFVNIQAWVIARFGGWKYEWGYQVVGVLGALVAGYSAKAASVLLIPSSDDVGEKLSFGAGLAVSGMMYLLGIALLLWACPWIIGTDRAELRVLVARLNGLMPLRTLKR